MLLSFLVKLAEPIVEYRYVSFLSKMEGTPHIGKECGPDDDEEGSESEGIFKNRLKLGKGIMPYCNDLEYLFFTVYLAKSLQSVSRQAWYVFFP
jgi:hypothetical protein